MQMIVFAVLMLIPFVIVLKDLIDKRRIRSKEWRRGVIDSVGVTRPSEIARHRHSGLIPVESFGEIVAFICGECDEQVDVDSEAGREYLRVKKISQGWDDVIEKLDAHGNQTSGQAGDFAERTESLVLNVRPEQMLWDRIPGWTDIDTRRAQRLLRDKKQQPRGLWL